MTNKKVRLPFYLEALALFAIPLEEAMPIGSGSLLRIINLFTIFISIAYFASSSRGLLLKGRKKLLVITIIFFLINIASIFWIYNSSLFLDSISTLALYVLLISLLAFLSPTKNEIWLMTKGLYFGGVFASLLIFVPGITTNLGDREALVVFGRYIDPNILSYSIVITSIINFCWLVGEQKNKYPKFLLIIVQLLTVFAIVTLGSRGCLISLVLPILVLLLKKMLSGKNRFRNFIIAVTLFAVLLFVYFFVVLRSQYGERFTVKNLLGLGEYGSANRLTIWKAAIKAFLKKPVFGYGCGSSPYAVAIYYKYYGTHNSYLRVLVELGVIGALIFALWFINLYKGIARKGSLFKYIFVSFIVFNIFIEGLSTKVFWGVVLLFTSVSYYQDKNVLINLSTICKEKA